MILTHWTWQGNHNQNRSNGSDKASAGVWAVRSIVALVMHRKHHFFWHRHRFAGVVNRFAGAFADMRFQSRLAEGGEMPPTSE